MATNDSRSVVVVGAGRIDSSSSNAPRDQAIHTGLDASTKIFVSTHANDACPEGVCGVPHRLGIVKRPKEQQQTIQSGLKLHQPTFVGHASKDDHKKGARAPHTEKTATPSKQVTLCT
jgi:hypothetical protein